MREIIFRAKRLDNGEWVQGYLFRIWDDTFIALGTTNGVPDMIKVISTTVCQYTGFKDKSDTQIFDGDIVYWYYEDANGEVFWDEDAARFAVNFPGVYADFDNFYGHELEVVGNMYDTPELYEDRLSED